MIWNSQGKVLWNFVKKYEPHILSAYLEKTFDPNCILVNQRGVERI